MTLILILATVGVVLISIAIGLFVRRHLADFDSYTSFRSRVGVLGITASMVGNIVGGRNCAAFYTPQLHDWLCATRLVCCEHSVYCPTS